MTNKTNQQSRKEIEEIISEISCDGLGLNEDDLSTAIEGIQSWHAKKMGEYVKILDFFAKGKLGYWAVNKEDIEAKGVAKGYEEAKEQLRGLTEDQEGGE